MRHLLLFSIGWIVALVVLSEQRFLLNRLFAEENAAIRVLQSDGALARGPKAATHPHTDADILPRATPPQDRVRA